jgi:protoporphyrinogen IX oxidase
MLYLWVKALHIIFVVALMASLLVYPRYKIHQLSSSPGELVLVLVLSGMHGYFIRLGKKVDRGGDGVSARQLRMLNEVPFLLMIVIIILVAVKPF